MKNEDMKISELLSQKKVMEQELANINYAVNALEKTSADPDVNHITLEFRTPRSRCRFKATDVELFELALKRKKVQEDELLPILRKLEAIELMLNS